MVGAENTVRAFDRGERSPDRAPERVPERSGAEAEAVAAVIEAGRRAAAAGWVPATSGNFSVRVDAARIAITATGADKGRLTPDDVLVVDVDGPRHPRSSAEAPLHSALYAADAQIGAVFHVHGPASTLISDLRPGSVRLAGYELLKAIRGVTTHDTAIEVPVFANSQDIPALTRIVADRLGPRPTVPAYLLSAHGLYAWGRSAAEAFRHLEALEFLFGIELQRERIRTP